LSTAQVPPEKLDSIRELLAPFTGKCPLFLCFSRPTGEIIFVETHEKYCVTPSRELQHAVDEEFGENTYYAKVDTSLPERQRRVWERKPEAAAVEA
jgi:hypothetical protein